MSEMQWRIMKIDCPVCGSNPVEIYTKSDKDNYGYEDEEMRCSECGAIGYWNEGTFGWNMEVPNEELLTSFYERHQALRTENESQAKEIAELRAERDSLKHQISSGRNFEAEEVRGHLRSLS